MIIGILNDTISKQLKSVYYGDMQETYNIVPSIK